MTGEIAERETRVNIQRLVSVYAVPRGHPLPEGLQSRMDALARDELPWSCRRILEQALDPKNPSLWFIRQLSASLTLDAGALDGGQLAHAWGVQLAKSMVETLNRGAENDSVVHFPDRSAYLAQFAVDLAEGCAWNKWYYEDSLRSLPVKQAVAEALAREPQHVAGTLRRLVESGGMEKVLAVLEESGARRVYQACLESNPPSAQSERDAVETALAAWPAAFPAGRNSNRAGSHAALRLLATAFGLDPDLDACRGLEAAIDHLLAFAELLRKVPDPEGLALRLAAGDLRGAMEKVEALGLGNEQDSLAYIEQVAQNDLAWTRRVVETVAPAVATPVRLSGRLVAGGRTFDSPFGGVFLLLPSLLQLDVEGILAAAPYPDLPETERGQLLRLILLLKLLGADCAPQAANDPAVLLAACMDKPIPMESLASFAKRATAQMNQECMRGLARVLFQESHVSGRYLWLEAAHSDKLGKLLLLRDLESDLWLWAGLCQTSVEGTPAALRNVLQDLAGIGCGSDGCLVVGQGVTAEVNAELISSIGRPVVWLQPGREGGRKTLLPESSGTRRTVWVKGSSALMDDDLRRLANLLPARRSLDCDLEYLTLAAARDDRNATFPEADFDLTWSLPARAALRAFARKLMGFDRSSLNYLRENFFSGTSTIRVQDNTISVVLPGCPLAVVLNMARVDGLTYSVPWLDGLQVELSLPSD